MMVKPNVISILGTGDFGRALAKPFLRSGVNVIFGSRHPGKRELSKCDPQLENVKIMSIEDAIQMSDVIVLAMHAASQAQLSVFEAFLTGKILVDVSNVEAARGGRKYSRTEDDDEDLSNAERLQRRFPNCKVVKAFNTLSAYTLMTGHSTASMTTYVAGDDHDAVQSVSALATTAGLNASVFGNLQSSRELERMQTRLFNGWGSPVILSFFIFSAWLTYGIVRYHYIKDHEWSRVPMNTMNKALGCAAITLLAFCFLPGCFAAFAQICYGSKHRRFSVWLDSWLKMRKQLGLIALWLAGLHTVLSVAHLNAGYFGKWFPKSKLMIPANHTDDILINLDSRMSWIGECVITFGTFSLGFMCILGITSLPSVGSKLNWRQWTFVQSYLGHACLFLAAVHVAFNACPSWGSTLFFYTVQKMSFLSLVIPLLTLFLRLVLVLPCFAVYIHRIRHGWERGSKNNIEAAAPTAPSSAPNGAVRKENHVNFAFSAEAPTVL